MCVGSLAVPFAAPVSAADHQSLHGTFRETAAGAILEYNISGSAKLTIETNATTATVNTTGLDPYVNYGSHLDNGPCASGGGHYQDSALGFPRPRTSYGGRAPPPTHGPLVPNKGGVAHGQRHVGVGRARIGSTTLSSARSIVVHQPGTGARIAYADLT